MLQLINVFVSLLLCVQIVYGQARQSKLMIIAHRGASAYAPENTIAAFRKAMMFGAEVLELDVRQTKDNQLIVLHDASVGRTTDGNGDVAELTLSQIKLLDAGSWFHPSFKNEKIPTLQEVIDILDSVTTLIIEIKGGGQTYAGIEQRVVELIQKDSIEQQVILKSFDKEVLETVRHLSENVQLLYVFVLTIPWLNVTIDHGLSFADVFQLNIDYIQSHQLFLTKSFVQKAHAHNYKVIAWGVDSESSMNEMIQLGVDGIETDYPDVLSKLINK